MFLLKSDLVELRGVANKTTKKNTVYYMLNVENSDGTAYSFYCPSADVFPQGMKKGDGIVIEFELKRFGTNERLVVHRIHKEV